MQKNKGRLFIISGPSGSGKDTLIRRVLRKHPEIRMSISSVTREPRRGDVEMGKYDFISREEFLSKLKEEAFLEYNEYLGNYYGTPKAPVEEWLREGRDVILEIDVNGAKVVKEKMPDNTSIFIMPPSMVALHNRLIGRSTEDIDTAKKRLREAVLEMRCSKDYDYVVINDNISKAVHALECIIESQQFRYDRMKNLINEVQNSAQSFHW